MGDESSSYAASGTRSILGETGHEVAALSHKMRFPDAGIAENTLYSLRARAGAEECAVLSFGRPGGAGPAAIFRPVLSWGGRRFPALRRHRQELAAARRLWRDRLRSDCADAFAAARGSRLSRGHLRSFWGGQFSCCVARAGAL